MKPIRFFLPLIIAGVLIFGVWLGFYLSNNLGSKNIEFIIPTGSNNKLSRILNYIDENYVDSVAKERLMDKAIQTILEDLDPHSYYISSEDFNAVNEPLEGNFEGIGIEFVVNDDTLNVVHTIAGGPSEKAGLIPGDQIIIVDSDTIAGVGIKNSDVVKLLRGEKGSEVSIRVKRAGKNSLIPVKIIRDEIPIKSVEVALDINDTTSYLKITRFAKTTFEEFSTAMDSVTTNNPNLKHLVIDLRNNGGGYLDAAIKICEELLPKGKLIVYTKGKGNNKKEYYSKKSGKYQNLNLTVLINEFSASASEIVAGAIQDHDRGKIVGRRSFGKGLVQEQLSLKDRSALRLTVARYYTPTGRCIQKPYGQNIDYDEDYYERYQNGELFHRDSIKVTDSLKFTTPKGKVVYGGGGIIPDVFVPLDTLGNSNILSGFMYVGNMNAAGFNLANKNREALKNQGLTSFLNDFTIPDSVLSDLLNQISAKKKDYQKLSPLQKEKINERFRGIVARHVWENEGFYLNSLRQDNMMLQLGFFPQLAQQVN